MAGIEVCIDDLLLDLGNPRFDGRSSQEDALEKIVVSQGRKLVNLADDIVSEGLSKGLYMRIVIMLLTAALVVALAGCASKNVRQDYSLTSDPNNGLVVFSLTHDEAGGRGTNTLVYFDGGPIAGHGGYVSSVRDVVPGMIRGGSDFEDSFGRLIVIELPEGRHEMTSWQIVQGGGGAALRLTPKSLPPPLQFEVTKGQVVYLGNVHANLQFGKNVFHMSILVDGSLAVQDQHERDIALFNERYPQFNGKMSTRLLPVGAWSNGEANRVSDIPILVPRPVAK